MAESGREECEQILFPELMSNETQTMNKESNDGLWSQQEHCESASTFLTQVYSVEGPDN